MSNDVETARKNLVKVLSSSANSADVAAIVEAVERLIDEKIIQATTEHEDFRHLNNDGGGF